MKRDRMERASSFIFALLWSVAWLYGGYTHISSYNWREYFLFTSALCVVW